MFNKNKVFIILFFTLISIVLLIKGYCYIHLQDKISNDEYVFRMFIQKGSAYENVDGEWISINNNTFYIEMKKDKSIMVKYGKENNAISIFNEFEYVKTVNGKDFYILHNPAEINNKLIKKPVYSKQVKVLEKDYYDLVNLIYKIKCSLKYDSRLNSTSFNSPYTSFIYIDDMYFGFNQEENSKLIYKLEKKLLKILNMPDSINNEYDNLRNQSHTEEDR